MLAMMINDVVLHAFWSPGPLEMLLIAGFALLLYGGDLPQVARSWGKSLTEFRRGLSGIQNEINDVVYGEPEPNHMEYRPEQTDPIETTSEESTSGESDESGETESDESQLQETAADESIESEDIYKSEGSGEEITGYDSAGDDYPDEYYSEEYHGESSSAESEEPENGGTKVHESPSDASDTSLNQGTEKN